MNDPRKPKKTPPMLKRDPYTNAIIDPNESRRIADHLLKKLATEQRLHEKDQSFHLAKGHKRDVVVHLSVTILPRVDGNNVIGETEREYNQWCFVFPARALPAPKGAVDKAFAELIVYGRQALMRLGMVRT